MDRPEMVSRELPGIGVCREFDLRSGRRLGVVVRRDHHYDLVIYDEDGDGALGAVTLDADEAEAVATVLGSHDAPVERG